MFLRLVFKSQSTIILYYHVFTFSVHIPENSKTAMFLHLVFIFQSIIILYCHIFTFSVHIQEYHNTTMFLPLVFISQSTIIPPCFANFKAIKRPKSRFSNKVLKIFLARLVIWILFLFHLKPCVSRAAFYSSYALKTMRFLSCYYLFKA